MVVGVVRIPLRPAAQRLGRENRAAGAVATGSLLRLQGGYAGHVTGSGACNGARGAGG